MEIHEISKLIVFTEQDLSDDILGNLIELPNFTQLLHKKPSLRAVIENNLKDISRESKARIQHSQASAKITDEALQFSKVSNLSPTHFMANIEAIVSCIPNDSPFYNQAHKLISLINNNNAEIKMKLFMLKWKESLSKQLISEELVLAEKEREDIEREIQKRLKIANIVCDTIEISSPGRLWNLSKSILIHDDLKHLKHYAQFLSRTPELRKIAEELGKAKYNEPKKIRNLEEETYFNYELDKCTNMPDDTSGIILGNNLTRLLPIEYMCLGDIDKENDFFTRFIEKRLMNYEFKGEDFTPKEIHSAHYSYGDLIEPKGPFIIAIDTSGSMNGYPEEAAKALCFALLQIALSENRQVFVIMFSTNLVYYELSKDSDLNTILNFLAKSFKGGTDFEPCIQKMLEIMESDNYQNADAVIISDFIAQRLKAETISKIKHIKTRGNKFNAIKLSKYGKTALMNIFDAQWTFDTGLTGRLLRKL